MVRSPGWLTMDQYAHTTDLIELRDELAIQQTILASLLDNPDPAAIDQTEVRSAQQAVSALCRQIKTVESRNPTKTKSSTALMNRHNRFSTPASASTSSASGAGVNRSKRRPPSSFDDDESNGYPNKSYKTTPSPAQTGITTPSFNDDFSTANEDAFIDLTGDDGDFQDIINKQRALFARHQQQREDEKMAKFLSQQWQPSGPVSGPSAPPAGPSAFDRIFDRPSQSQSQHQEHHLTPPSSLASFHANARDVTSAPVPQNPRMPGSYILEEDDDGFDGNSMDLSFLQEEQGHLFPSFYSAARRPASNASLQWNSQVPAPGPSLTPEPPPRFPTHAQNVPAAELARRAALARRQAYQTFGGPSSSNVNGYRHHSHLNPFDDGSTMASSVYRPGMLTSGSYQPLSMTRVHNSVFPPRPSANGTFPGNTLSNLIGRTNGIDWVNGLDAFGNPLNDRLMNYYEDLQDDPRKTQEEIRDLLANIRPDEEIPKEDRMGTPDALRYPLYDHQKLALKWMTDSETGSNKGGILADDMGLGKTISTIALLVSRQATDRLKTNLIVGPVALLKQWELELKKKLKSAHHMSILLLHGKNATYEELRRFDVVLTSYGKLGHEEKRYQKWLEHHPGADASADIGLAKSCPLVHPKSKFYRVILDEAQCIKNVNTFQAKGAAHLQATYRWCLTGTPMMNGIHELYSLIRFLKIAPYHNQKEFNKRFGSLSAKSARSRAAGEYSRTSAMDALRVLLKAIMLRRMKTSKLDGKPLLTLPPKTEEVVHVVFDDDEMDFYKTLEARTKITFNKYLRANTVGKNYSNVLVLLLRLRQACCHPHLNLDVEYVGSSEVDQDDMATLAKTLAPDVVNRLKAANEEGFNCPICLDAVIDPTIVLPCGHNSCGECFSTLVAGATENNIRSGEEGNNIKCPECRGPINPKQVINLTAFKAVHMPETETSNQAPQAESADEDSDDDDDDDDSDSSDSDSDTEGGESGHDVDRNGNLKDFIVQDDEEEDSAGEQQNNDENDDGLDGLFVPQCSASSGRESNKAKAKATAKSGKGKGKEKQKKEKVEPHMLKTLRLEAKKNKAQYKRYMKYLKKNWMTSAKVSKCCDILQGIQESGDKTIVFSQFTFLLDLLEIPIKYDLGIKYCRYDGGMTRQQRDAATMDFQDPNSRTKVMLISLKAGNAGLNLTAANHVIIMDPFWNFFVESQAVDRAHRIGQQKPVQVHRLLTQETVEDRIIEIQEQKRQFVDAALDEGESKNLGRLSLQDLQFLFNGRE